MTVVDTPPGVDTAQLVGSSIALTSDRRSEELIASFRRRGAQVLHAPTLRIVPLAEDATLIHATDRLLADPPTDVIVTTAIGLRGWVEVADAAGRAPQLLDVLGRARLLARGPKARGALRACGLVEDWSAESELTAEIVDRLLAEGVRGRRIAFQLHGVVDDDQLARLRAAGALVEAVPVYRWGPSPDPAAVQRAIEAVCAAAVDAVVFTSAPGARAFVEAADAAGRLPDLCAALRREVLAAAVGEVTAGPLRAVGVAPVLPDRFRIGALVRVVADHIVQRRPAVLRTAAGSLELRGSAAVVDGRVIPLAPAPLALLRTLARARGDVVDRPTLLARLPGAADEHAVEVTIARLRAAIGVRGLVETVVKRGYRLAAPSG